MTDIVRAALSAHCGLDCPDLTPLTGGYIHQVWRAGDRVAKLYRGRDRAPASVAPTLERQAFAPAAPTAGAIRRPLPAGPARALQPRPRVAAFLQGYGEADPGCFRIWFDYLLTSLYPLPQGYQPGAALPEGWADFARRRHAMLLLLDRYLPDLERWAHSPLPPASH
jgi:hypothetical protein